MINNDWNLSNCCGAPFFPESDICVDCLEHADITEVWVELVNLGFPTYFVSSYGDFISYAETPERRRSPFPRLIRQSKTHDGYPTINMRSKTFLSARIIAKTFVANPFNKPTVEHIDHVRNNNKANNLMWLTHREQQISRYQFAKQQRALGVMVR